MTVKAPSPAARHKARSSRPRSSVASQARHPFPGRQRQASIVSIHRMLVRCGPTPLSTSYGCPLSGGKGRSERNFIYRAQRSRWPSYVSCLRHRARTYVQQPEIVVSSEGDMSRERVRKLLNPTISIRPPYRREPGDERRRARLSGSGVPAGGRCILSGQRDRHCHGNQGERSRPAWG